MHTIFTYFLSFVRSTPARIALLLVFAFSFAPYAYAAYQQYLPGTEVTIGEFVFDDDFQATTTAGCTITIYDPNGSVAVNAASMTATANSWYEYSFTPAETRGIWPAFMTCGSSGNGSLVRGDKTFEITDNLVSSSSVAALVNANTNTAVANASSSLAATLPNSIWAFSGRTLTSFGTLVADIWANGTRSLTTFGTLAADIWASGTRTLTGFGTLAADVWTNGTRTLTGAGLTSGSLATLSDVQTATSSLGSAITNSQTAINANTDTRVGIASSSLATVINANTNTTVLTASTSLGLSLGSIASSITTLPAAVWNVATTTMTTPGTIGYVLANNIDIAISAVSGGGGGLTAADVWAYGTRSLTSASLTSGTLATLLDVQTASSSVVALVNANTNSATSGITTAVNSNTDATVLAASSSLATSIPVNVWNSSVRTLSSFGTLVSDIWSAGSRTLTGFGTLAADVWTNGTRTLTGASLSSGSLALQSDVATASSSLGSAITASQTAINSNTDTRVGVASSSIAAVVNANTNAAVLAASSSLGTAITNSQTAINANTDSRVGTASSSLAAVINGNTNTVVETASSSLAAVVNANTNATVLTASTSLGSTLSSIASSITSIPANVWAAGSRTLTGFGTLAADVWTNGTRTLTGASLSSGSLATLSDVQTASSSVVAIVNANTDARVTTASSSLGSAITNSQTAVNSNTNATVLAASSSLATSIPINVWNASVRTLTGFGTLASDVWSAATRTLTGAGLTTGSLATLSDVQTATSSLGSAITNSQTAINANTDTRVGIATSSLAAVVNANTNATVLTASTSLGSTLSSIASSITSIPANVWAAGSRTLTGFGTLAADVWTNGTRTLTGASLSSGSLALQSDVTTASSSLGSAITNSQTAINGNTDTRVGIASSSIAAVVNSNTDSRVAVATSSLAAVINTNTNSAVLTASTSLGSSISALPAAVWNVATTTMTTVGSIGKVLATNIDTVLSTIGGGSLTPADIWAYGTRSLTSAALNSGALATNVDINNATTSVNATIGTASSSLAAVINANTNATVLTASTSLASGIASGFASVPANVWAYSSRTLTAFGTLATDVWSAATRTLTGAGLTSGSLATQTDIQNATTSLAAAIATKATLVNQQAGWTVRQSDFGSVLAGSTFRTKVTVLNYQSAPTTPFATPTVTVYDASRNVVASGVAMTALSTGVYEYTYSVASLAVQGQWEAVVSTQVESGKTITTNDYFEVAGSPAQVLIQSMGSLATPNITANVRITNEGLADYEYQYEWCVVSDINNPCGGGNDTYYASAAKLINAGDNFDTVLSATVPTEGIYYFKTVVYFGTESSGASRQFTTSLYVPPTPPTGGGHGGGGGGGSGSSGSDSGSCGIADINCDGKVSAVDFSIMLAYWKTFSPFANARVDLNLDKKVDAVDFSILLYHWGKRY